MALKLIRGWAKDSPRPEWFEKWTGFRLAADGDDWIIPDDDPQLNAGPRPILIAGEPSKLAAARYVDIAEGYVDNYLESDLEARQLPLPSRLPIKSGYGLRSELEREQLEFFFTPRARLPQKLARRILPFMAAKFPVTHVTPLRLAAGYQQAILSIAKVPLLVQQYGLAEAKALLGGGKRERAWDSILPKATDVVTYLDALLFAMPLAMALPMHRVGSALYFVGSHIQLLPRLATDNMIGQMTMSPSPMVHDAVEAGNTLFQLFRGFPTRPYLRAAVETVNGMMRFLNDPRSFAVDGVFDGEMMLRTQCIVHLMFADLLAASHTGSRYSRDRLAFSFLDKVANLNYGFNRAASEGQTFRLAFARTTGDRLALAIKEKFKQKNETLGRDMAKFTRAVYANIHNHLSRQLGIPAASESDILDRLWALRGTNHGAFLKGSKFEDLFYKSATTVPPGVQFLPLIFAWAMGANFALVAKLTE